jgi:hypothetical protein
MGSRNVSAALAMWSDLPDGPFRVLLGMAHRTLDDNFVHPETGRFTPARRWFAGRDELADLVRGGGRPRATRERAAWRFLGQLVDAGAVTCAVKGAPGRRAEYVLQLDAMPDGDDGAPEGSGEAPSATRSDPNVCDDVADERVRPGGHNVCDHVATDVCDHVAHQGTTDEQLTSYEEEQSRPPAASTDRGREVEAGLLVSDYEAARDRLAGRFGMLELIKLVDEYSKKYDCSAAHAVYEIDKKRQEKAA